MYETVWRGLIGAVGTVLLGGIAYCIRRSSKNGIALNLECFGCIKLKLDTNQGVPTKNFFGCIPIKNKIPPVPLPAPRPDVVHIDESESVVVTLHLDGDKVSAHV